MIDSDIKVVDYIISYIDFNQKEIRDLYKDVTGNEFDSIYNYTYLDITKTIELILKNLPFINKLYITCKDIQKFPDSLNTLIQESNGRIIRANESSFMPNNYISFSSACIEMFLWNIPGLSEYFIYGNDDMIPLKPVSSDCFFINKKPAMYFIYRLSAINCMYELHNLNATNLVYNRQINNYEYKYVWYSEHSLRPLTKSICIECYNKYKKYIINSLHPVRFFNNFNIDLYMIYGMYTENIYNINLNYNFLYTTLRTGDELLFIKNYVDNNEYNNICDIICLNDNIISEECCIKTKNYINDIINYIENYNKN